MEHNYNQVHQQMEKHPWIILPTDKGIQKFDFITGILVFYDSFMIPFKNTFGTAHFG